MANKECLEILRKGAEEWNRWRKERDKVSDFRLASLSNANLRNADLRDLRTRLRKSQPLLPYESALLPGNRSEIKLRINFVDVQVMASPEQI